MGLGAVPALDSAVSCYGDGRVRSGRPNAFASWVGPEAAPSLVAVLRDPGTAAELAGRAAAALASIGGVTPDVLAALTEARGREEDIPGLTPVADALHALRAAV